MQSITETCEHTKDSNAFVQKGGVFPFTFLGKFGPVLGYYTWYRNKRSPKIKFRQRKEDPLYEVGTAYHEQVHSAFVVAVKEMETRKAAKEVFKEKKIDHMKPEDLLYDPKGDTYYDYQANDSKEQAHDNIQTAFSFLKETIHTHKRLRDMITDMMKSYYRTKGAGFFKARKYVGTPPNWYWKTNIHEFFTCAFTDPKFQFFLTNVPYEREENGEKKKENMFQYLLTQSNNFLGVDAVKPMNFADFVGYANSTMKGFSFKVPVPTQIKNSNKELDSRDNFVENPAVEVKKNTDVEKEGFSEERSTEDMEIMKKDITDFFTTEKFASQELSTTSEKMRGGYEKITYNKKGVTLTGMQQPAIVLTLDPKKKKIKVKLNTDDTTKSFFAEFESLDAVYAAGDSIASFLTTGDIPAGTVFTKQITDTTVAKERKYEDYVYNPEEQKTKEVSGVKTKNMVFAGENIHRVYDYPDGRCGPAMVYNILHILDPKKTHPTVGAIKSAMTSKKLTNTDGIPHETVDAYLAKHTNFSHKSTDDLQIILKPENMEKIMEKVQTAGTKFFLTTTGYRKGDTTGPGHFRAFITKDEGKTWIMVDPNEPEPQIVDLSRIEKNITIPAKNFRNASQASGENSAFAMSFWNAV